MLLWAKKIIENTINVYFCMDLIIEFINILKIQCQKISSIFLKNFFLLKTKHFQKHLSVIYILVAHNRSIRTNCVLKVE